MKETWAGLRLSVFFLLRASELKQMRQKGIDVSVEWERESLSLYAGQKQIRVIKDAFAP